MSQDEKKHAEDCKMMADVLTYLRKHVEAFVGRGPEVERYGATIDDVLGRFGRPGVAALMELFEAGRVRSTQVLCGFRAHYEKDAGGHDVLVVDRQGWQDEPRYRPVMQ